MFDNYRQGLLSFRILPVEQLAVTIRARKQQEENAKESADVIISWGNTRKVGKFLPLKETIRLWFPIAKQISANFDVLVNAFPLM